jgi:GNAT superfamily N-acetyltransferase
VSVKIDWLAAGRIHELQTFVEEHWRAGHILARNEELLRWQHRLPDEERLSILVADDAGGIVGMLGFIPFRACVRGDEARGGWMTNWLVVPSRRGEGLGRRLVERVLDREFDLVGALAGNETTQRVLGGLGFWAQASMPRWILVRSTEALAQLLGESASSYPDTAWRAWRSHELLTPPAAELEVGSWDAAAGHAWDDVFRRRLATDVIGTWRDSDHIRHRFVEHPVFSYEILVADAGIAVFRIEPVAGGTHSVMRVVDFLADESRAGSLAAALAAAADERGVVFADFFCTSMRFGAAFEEAGFVLEQSLPARLPARFQPLDFSDRALASSFWIGGDARVSAEGSIEAADLYVTRADSDLDRPN